MPFKVNVSHKGKTGKFEIDNESLIGLTIGEKVRGEEISSDLAGYELEITGTSDKAGFAGKKDLKGPNLQKMLTTYGWGMKKKPKKGGKKEVASPKGLRLRKTVRGNEISSDTVQINTILIKEGTKKFEDILKEGAPIEGTAEEVSKEEKKEKAPKEKAKEEEKE